MYSVLQELNFLKLLSGSGEAYYILGIKCHEFEYIIQILA